jgi:hypothetical protein
MKVDVAITLGIAIFALFIGFLALFFDYEGTFDKDRHYDNTGREINITVNGGGCNNGCCGGGCPAPKPVCNYMWCPQQ